VAKEVRSELHRGPKAFANIWKDMDGIVRMNELIPPDRMTFVYITEYTFFSTLCGEK
jgi:hypothetical protein